MAVVVPNPDPTSVRRQDDPNSIFNKSLLLVTSNNVDQLCTKYENRLPVCK